MELIALNESERKALQRSDWAPPDVDIDTPSTARIYDYLLGGSHNFESDRAFARKLIGVCPFVRELAILNRRFLMTAVRWLAAQGVTQFLDLGAGLPAAGSVHEIVREVNPDAKVVYVDSDPVAIAHGELMVNALPGVAYIDADFTRPRTVFAHELTRATLDSQVPTAVILCAALHLVPDAAKPATLVEEYGKRAGAGSWLVLSHGTTDYCPPMEDVVGLYRQATNQYYPRNREQVAELLASVELTEEGQVLSAQWRPDMPMTIEAVMRSGAWVGVGQWR